MAALSFLYLPLLVIAAIADPVPETSPDPSCLNITACQPASASELTPGLTDSSPSGDTSTNMFSALQLATSAPSPGRTHQSSSASSSSTFPSLSSSFGSLLVTSSPSPSSSIAPLFSSTASPSDSSFSKMIFSQSGTILNTLLETTISSASSYTVAVTSSLVPSSIPSSISQTSFTSQNSDTLQPDVTRVLNSQEVDTQPSLAAPSFQNSATIVDDAFGNPSPLQHSSVYLMEDIEAVSKLRTSISITAATEFVSASRATISMVPSAQPPDKQTPFPRTSFLNLQPSSDPTSAVTDSNPADSDVDSQKNKYRALTLIFGILLALICITTCAFCLLVRRRHEPMTTEINPSEYPDNVDLVMVPESTQEKDDFVCVDLEGSPTYCKAEKAKGRSQEITVPLESRFSVTSSDLSVSIDQFTSRLSRQSRHIMNFFTSMIRHTSSTGGTSPLLTPQEFFTLPMGDIAPYRRWHEIVQNSNVEQEAGNAKKLDHKWLGSDNIV